MVNRLVNNFFDMPQLLKLISLGFLLTPIVAALNFFFADDDVGISFGGAGVFIFFLLPLIVSASGLLAFFRHPFSLLAMPTSLFMSFFVVFVLEFEGYEGLHTFYILSGFFVSLGIFAYLRFSPSVSYYLNRSRRAH